MESNYSQVLMMKTALTIAGSDSDGMAGIQADLKTFKHFKVHGLSVITAITAQAPEKVLSIHTVPAESISDQFEAVRSSFNIDGIKTGMLYTANTIEILREKLHKYDGPLIIDPVMIAGSGALLLQEDAIIPLIDTLLPLATIITPNIHEAERIAKIKIRTLEDMKIAAKKMRDMGIQGILMKGSHLNTPKITDMFYLEDDFHIHEKKRINASAHGTGCVFSAALLAGIINGSTPQVAFHRAEDHVSGIMKERALLENEQIMTLEREFRQGIARLENSKGFCKLIAEVRSNLAVGSEQMRSLEDIVTTEGRITQSYGYPIAIGPLELGGIHHVPRLLLSAQRLDNSIRAAINIRFKEEHVEACQLAKLDVQEIDRRKEPPKNLQKEGGTMEWVVEEVYKRHGKIPDAIFDRGDFKKEPMIRIFGRSATDVINKIFRILSFL